MKFYTYILLLFALLGCNSNQKTFDNKNNLNQLIDAYLFLSENHDLLHIMMGEYEGSPIEAYREYQEKIAELKNNNHLKPIFHGLNNLTKRSEVYL